MDIYPSLSVVPALPTSAGKPVKYLAAGGVVVVVEFVQDGYWLVSVEDGSDDREGYLRTFGDVWGIQVSGTPTADAMNLVEWREALGRFF